MALGQLGGKAVGRVGIGDVQEFAAYLGAGDGRRGRRDAVEVAARQVHDVCRCQALREALDQRQAQALGGAGDQGDLR